MIINLTRSGDIGSAGNEFDIFHKLCFDTNTMGENNKTVRIVLYVQKMIDSVKDFIYVRNKFTGELSKIKKRY